jgi:hypothetical protein
LSYKKLLKTVEMKNQNLIDFKNPIHPELHSLPKKSFQKEPILWNLIED